MILSSMTGFARAAGATGPVQWAWEVRSVNGRGLEVRLRVPNGHEAAGEIARTALQKTLARGQCQLSLTLTRPEAAPRLGRHFSAQLFHRGFLQRKRVALWFMPFLVILAFLLYFAKKKVWSRMPDGSPAH